MDTKYKVKLNNGRLLGPLDFERVQALARKGHFLGKEATSVTPFSDWREFSSFPELAELLLQKIEGERQPKRPSAVTNAPDPTRKPPPTLTQNPNEISKNLTIPSIPNPKSPTLWKTKPPPPPLLQTTNAL